MTSPSDGDLESRVQALERQIAELRERLALTATDAGAARVLAAGADRDVSEVRAELRAHILALNALRENQLEMQTEMRAGFAEMHAGFAEMRAGFDEIGQRFAVVGAGMTQITDLLTAMDDSG